jgi:hypothetical protein
MNSKSHLTFSIGSGFQFDLPDFGTSSRKVPTHLLTVIEDSNPIFVPVRPSLEKGSKLILGIWATIAQLMPVFFIRAYFELIAITTIFDKATTFFRYTNQLLAKHLTRLWYQRCEMTIF